VANCSDMSRRACDGFSLRKNAMMHKMAGKIPVMAKMVCLLYIRERNNQLVSCDVSASSRQDVK